MRRKLTTTKIFLSLAACAALLCLFLSACSHIIILKDPLTPEEHIKLGVAYEQKGELDAAIDQYSRAIKEDRKNSAAYLFLGNSWFEKKDYAKAEKNYRKAIAASPANAEAYNNLAWLLYTEKTDLQEARALSAKAAQLEPSNKDFKDTLAKIEGASKAP
ncbi:MAG: tetratricopeptide repeat protein [Actinomycetota bacterium]|nr:tetratricopeptide repeat protein [Actinomycetota bacterium]